MVKSRVAILKEKVKVKETEPLLKGQRQVA